MEAKELLSKSQAELSRMGDELRAELRAIRFKVATRQYGKVRDLRRLRRDLARIEAARSHATT